MNRAPDRHLPIDDYALIGNTHSAALLAPDGSIDWCCLPHFDSGAVFCRLLDLERGGFLRFGPQDLRRSTRCYRAGTAVLETEHDTATGRVRSVDFMPVPRLAEDRLGQEDRHCHRLMRRLECVSGRVTVTLEFWPTFDFAREPCTLQATADGACAAAGASGGLRLRLVPPRPLEIRDGRAVGCFELVAGERLWLVCAHADAQAEDGDAALDEPPEDTLARTLHHWREWDACCRYDGPYRDEVRASARVLKLLTFGPTGALVAAPTSSLPEAIGGERNWDYRFCWLRDAALVLRSLMALGYREAAHAFFVWLEDLCAEDEGDDTLCDDLQIMHRLDGRREMPEEVLTHLSGYRDSAPVRVGNGAARQKQLDIYGHVLDAAWICLEDPTAPVRPGFVRVLRHFADEAAARWREPDQGLWEARREPQHFVSSKLMCWVALDRALRLVGAGRLDGDVGRWQRERDAIRETILERGWQPRVGAFTQVLDGEVLDASVLMMPLVGFLPAQDPRMRATVERVAEQLSTDGFVCRYRDDDGLPGEEATFTICSYWLVDNLALQGRLDEACALFERIGSHASDLGLMAEEIDVHGGQQLGNYPQGFTHLAQIQSALTIERMRREKDRGGGGPVSPG